jgi:hypothetical protein
MDASGGGESGRDESSKLPEADADARERPQLPRRFTGGGSCGRASRALDALLGCDDRGEVLDDSDIGPNGGRGAVAGTAGGGWCGGGRRGSLLCVCVHI